MTTTTRCELCSRVLTDQASVARRVGPECEGKLAAQLNAVGAAVSALAGGYRDPLLKRSLELLSVAELYATRSAVARKDAARLRARIAARVERLAAAEAVAA
jgi:uncharacterized small protein (DUF1192 family)